MATPAQTQVTLDASQFIQAVDHIGNSIDAMNKSIASSNQAFASFAVSGTNMEKTLNSISASMVDSVKATNENVAATKALIAVQQQMAGVLNQVAISTRASAQSLDTMATSATKAGQQGKRAAQEFTFAWDGIARLLAVTVIRRIFLDIAGAIQQSVAASAEFTERVGHIMALNQNLGTSVQALSQQFANLSLASGRSLNEVGQAGQQAVQSGVARTAEQIDQVTGSAIRLAEATGSTLPQAMTATTAVMRAFNLDAIEAQNVTNQLFHLAQNGIGLEAIGGSIGRVAAQAQRLGISFSELGLFMEHIKATGVSDAEVMTQVAAVLNSLERPTQRLNELLGERGFLSPQQLIQAQRFHGALQLINQDISEGNIQARQALQSRRAGGGLSVAEGFAQASRNNPLDNVNQLQQGADAALRIVDATGRWNDELEKIKTTFQSEVAPAIIKSILDVFEPMGGLAKVVTDAGRQIALLIDPVARVVSWFAVWGGWLERCAEFLGILNPATRQNAEAMRQFADAAREGGERLATWVATQRQMSRQALQEGSQAIANFFAPLNSALNRQSELQRERVHQLGEQIEATSKSVFGGFAAQIDSLESVARQAESRINDSLKRVSGLADKTAKDSFESRLKSAGEVSQVNPFTSEQQRQNAENLLEAQNNASDNQLRLIADRRKRLQDEIAELQNRGDADSIDRARRRFEELRRLNDQEMDIRAGAARRRAEFDARATGQNTTFNPFNREREAGARRLNAAEEAFEAANRRRLAAQQQALEAINRQLRERLRLAQDGQRDVGRLPQRLFEANGTPRQQFQGTAGGASATGLINRTIDAEIQRLRELPAAIERGIQDALRRGAITPEQAEQARRRAPSQEEILRLIQQLEGQRGATTALFQNAEARRVSEANQREQIALLQRIADNTNQSIARAAENRQETQRVLQEALVQIGRVREATPGRVGLTLEQGNADAFRIATRELPAAIAEAERRIQTAARTGTAQDNQSAEEAIRIVRNLASDLQRARGSNQELAGTGPLSTALRRLEELMRDRPIRDAVVQGAQQTQQEVNRAIQNANPNGPGGVPPATVQQSIAAFESLATSISQGGRFPNALSELATATSTAAQSIAAATANLQRPAVPPAPAAPAINPNMFDGGFAKGGLIGNTFSSFGPDDTTIRAKRGEFVVNPEDTRKWYSTLVAINRGDSPRGGGYAHGGTVTTSIGNMNFHVSGAESPENTARAVMKIIRREQRRGNV